MLDDLLTINVASLSKGKKSEGKVPSDAQVADLHKTLEEPEGPVRAAVMLAVILDLRRSEICGLRWGDVEFESKAIRIRNAVTEFSGTVYEVEDTKTRMRCAARGVGAGQRIALPHSSETDEQKPKDVGYLQWVKAVIDPHVSHQLGTTPPESWRKAFPAEKKRPEECDTSREGSSWQEFRFLAEWR